MFVVHEVSRDQSLYEISAKSPAELLRIFADVMSRRDLTFDLFTLNFYSTSGVMHLNSIQNLSEIELFTAELSTI